jgi:hypothetical protein
MAGRRVTERLAKLCEFARSADELRETSGGRRAEPGPERSGAHQLVCFYRRRQALDRNRAERPDLHIPLGKPEGRAGYEGSAVGRVDFRRTRPDILTRLLWTIPTFPPPRTAGWNTSRMPPGSHGAASGLGQDFRMACTCQEHGVDVSSDPSEPSTGSVARVSGRLRRNRRSGA